MRTTRIPSLLHYVREFSIKTSISYGVYGVEWLVFVSEPFSDLKKNSRRETENVGLLKGGSAAVRLDIEGARRGLCPARSFF